MNIIFLDMDGVVVTNRSCIEDSGVMGQPDPIAIKMLNKLCHDYNAKIVLSSSWRNMFEPKAMLHILKGMGILTKHIYMDGWPDTFYTPSLRLNKRGYEITAWLGDMPHVKNYVIFDDNTDMLEEQAEHFVNTNTYDGISMANYRRARKILAGEKIIPFEDLDD